MPRCMAAAELAWRGALFVTCILGAWAVGGGVDLIDNFSLEALNVGGLVL